jgi:hypothetical protein
LRHKVCGKKGRVKPERAEGCGAGKANRLSLAEMRGKGKSKIRNQKSEKWKTKRQHNEGAGGISGLFVSDF